MLAPVLALLMQVPAAEIEEAVPRIMKEDRIPAVVLVVGSVRKIEYRKAFGEAKLDTIFDLASLTKVVGTSTAALKLAEEGKLSLDDPVEKHLPVFEGKGFTVRQLLQHRTGLPAYWNPEKPTAPDEALAKIASMEADGKYRYSCLNMTVLARVVEKALGMPLDRYLKENYVGLLGMRDTSYEPPAGRCAPTSEAPAGVVHDPLARFTGTKEHRPGNAGLFSTGEDLAKFCRALLKGWILRPDTLKKAFTADEEGHGLGWVVYTEPPLGPGVGHTGYTGTSIWIDPAKKRYVVLLTNRVYPDDKASVSRLREEVVKLVNR